MPDIDRGQFELGYYEPGHGTKGKKRWLTCDEDMEDMKESYKKKKTEVLLWCYDPSIPRVGRKRCREGRSNEHDPDQPTPKSKSRSRFESAYEKKMGKVEEIYEKLREKHGKKFKPEQLRAWANMMQLDKHSSLDEPPSGLSPQIQSRRVNHLNLKRLFELEHLSHQQNLRHCHQQRE